MYNDIFHQPMRTKIMALLYNAKQVEFSEIKKTIGLTDGNMTRHMGKLVDNNYVTVEKIPHGKKTKTIYSITTLGEKAFKEYLMILQSIINECED
jgi:DNA-binding MarR family transcriptional regulator